MPSTKKNSGFLERYFSIILWERKLDIIPPPRRQAIICIQFLLIVLYNAWRNQFFLRASALAFTSVLSLVPFLAIIFSVLKGFGIQNQMAPLVLERLSAGSQDVAIRIIHYIDNTNMTSLGGFGVTGLFVTVIMLLDSIEDAFNNIWLVKETRPIGRKLGGYLILLVSLPILISIALTMTTFLEGQTEFNWIITTSRIGKILPYILHLIPFVFVCTALTCLYMLVPNKRVRLLSAVTGALFAGTLWQLTQWAYVHMQIGVAKNNAIYGTMAALPTFMVWIYLSWLIVLLGVEIVHVHQDIRSLKREFRAGPVSQSVRDLLSLAILQDIAMLRDSTAEGWTGEHFGDAFDIPERVLKVLLADLVMHGYIIATGDNSPVYRLAQEPDTIMVYDVLHALHDPPGGWQPEISTRGESYLAELLETVDKKRLENLAGLSLKHVADACTDDTGSSSH